MKITYTGPHDAVDVETPYAGTVTIARGDEIDVPDVYAASLLEQSCWEVVKKPRKHTRELSEGEAN